MNDDIILMKRFDAICWRSMVLNLYRFLVAIDNGRSKILILN